MKYEKVRNFVKENIEDNLNEHGFLDIDTMISDVLEYCDSSVNVEKLTDIIYEEESNLILSQYND